MRAKASHKRLWFKRRTFGYGWTPVTWEGWTATIIYIVILIFGFYLFDSDATSREDTLYSAGFIFISATFGLFLICYMKGEKPGIRWGSEENSIGQSNSVQQNSFGNNTPELSTEETNEQQKDNIIMQENDGPVISGYGENQDSDDKHE